MGWRGKSHRLRERGVQHRQVSPTWVDSSVQPRNDGCGLRDARPSGARVEAFGLGRKAAMTNCDSEAQGHCSPKISLVRCSRSGKWRLKYAR